MDPSLRRSSPAAVRNRDPIRQVLERILPPRGLILEIASGTGEHVVWFGQHLSPLLIWQPGDPDPRNRESIEAWREWSGLSNIRPPIDLDVTTAVWPIDQADAILNFNMIHISPGSCCEGLMAGAARVLVPGGLLVMYGPYRRLDQPTAPSNEAFDQDLKARNPDWGLRSLEAVIEIAARNGLEHRETVDMPSNNLTVIYQASR